MTNEAIYFDGETARDNKVASSVFETSGLRFSGDSVPVSYVEPFGTYRY